MRLSSLKKIEKIITIALVFMVLVSIGLITAWISLRNQEVEEQSRPETIESKASPAANDLTDKIDYKPDKCTLNQKLPDLSFTKENGGKLTLESMRGKVIVLNFWASWCPHCKKELEQSAKIKIMLDKYKDVDYWLVDKLDSQKETRDMALSYLKDNSIPLSTVFDVDIQVYKQLGIKIIPTTLVIDKQGVLRAWYTGDNLDAGVLESMINYAQNGGSDGVLSFITNKLMNADGGIKTNYLQEKDSKLSYTDVLSESQGLMMEYAILKRDKALFEQSLKYVTSKMEVDPLTAWIVTKEGASRVNSALDDLRIYSAMSKANSIWGGYSSKLDNYEKALHRYNTENQELVNEYDFKNKKKSQQLKLCYADFEALKLLAETNPTWEKVYQNSLDIVERGSIGGSFPLYYGVYDYNKKNYRQDSVNMAEEMVTLLHLARIHRLPDKTVAWLKAAVEGKGIFSRYETDGSVSQGYGYESTAIYGLVSMIAEAIGDKDLANKALIRMEAARVFDTQNKVNGAFGNVDGTGIYSFDQLISLLAYSSIEERDVR